MTKELKAVDTIRNHLQVLYMKTNVEESVSGELDIIETTLEQLAGIKEELGIDLITLFKALRQDNVWVKEHNTEEQEIVYERIRLNFLNRTLDFVYPRKEIGKGRNLSDYGKTWALTKEELLCLSTQYIDDNDIIEKSCKDRAEYNDLASKEEELTQEEYELLKEVLL